MQTSPHPHTLRRTIVNALIEVVKIDLIVVPAVFVAAIVFWIIGLGSQLPYSAVPEWAFALWAAISGLSVTTLGFDFSLAPSLVTLGLWLLVAAAVKRLVTGVAAADWDDDEVELGQWWTIVGAGLGTFTVAYAAPLLALALAVGQATMTPLGFLRLFLFLVTALFVGCVRARGVGDFPGLRLLDDRTWDVGVRLARRLVWGALAAAVIILVVGFVLGWEQVTDSMQVYSSPVAAGIGLLIVQVLFAPGILFSALSWSAGTGVVLGGAGTSSAFSATASPVPDVPALQLLTVDYPAWTAIAPVLLILLGLLCTILGRFRAREVAESSWPGIGIAAGIVFVGGEALGLFSFGALGPLGLADFGPPALTSALVITAWIGVGMLVGLLLIRLANLQAGPGDDGLGVDVDGEYFGDSTVALDDDEVR
ncbi:cell division protein PerM [Brevibacterium atlanticum]|uniref:cell division protein PerM n=1 Tax=Brevibacterium atlanticum TaxID=2697563 RepID=UPI001AA0D260|nr:DUF6350 family protein [Brevibacterium atlanticum]